MTMWSNDKPTAPGFYWCHQRGKTRIVHIWCYKNGTELFTNEDGGASIKDALYDGAQWMAAGEPPNPQDQNESAQPAPNVPDGVIEQAVTRFLSWKLPKDFHPDGGMVFIPTKGRGYDSPYWPSGTNLFNAEQAREMLRYVLAAAPEDKP